LRIAPPQVLDEARNVVYYLDELSESTVPEVLGELTEQLRRFGHELPVDGRPLSFGRWIGGDRDGSPNVAPESVAAVLALQHRYGLRRAVALIDGLRGDLSLSTRLGTVTTELERSLATDLELLVEVAPRYRRLNAASTPRSRID
jgi:phosphoenolpyruvate carboxylase